MKIRQEDKKTRKQEDKKTRKQEDKKTRRQEDKKTRRQEDKNTIRQEDKNTISHKTIRWKNLFLSKTSSGFIFLFSIFFFQYTTIDLYDIWHDFDFVIYEVSCVLNNSTKDIQFDPFFLQFLFSQNPFFYILRILSL